MVGPRLGPGKIFGLKAVRLMSNNPEKVEAVEKAGVQVVERVPCLADVLHTRLAYLRTKREKMGHLLEFDDL
jgi:GTP cyclohydrolase II